MIDFQMAVGDASEIVNVEAGTGPALAFDLDGIGEDWPDPFLAKAAYRHEISYTADLALLSPLFGARVRKILGHTPSLHRVIIAFHRIPILDIGGAEGYHLR
jgi:hypothetical protein